MLTLTTKALKFSFDMCKNIVRSSKFITHKKLRHYFHKKTLNTAQLRIIKNRERMMPLNAVAIHFEKFTIQNATISTKIVYLSHFNITKMCVWKNFPKYHTPPALYV